MQKFQQGWRDKVWFYNKGFNDLTNVFITKSVE